MSKEMILKLFLGLACWFTLSPATSLADMTLDKSVIHFEPGKPKRQDVMVKNNQNTPLYIKVTPYTILNPGTDKQSREKITNPKKSGLLVSPSKLVVPPNGKKLIRLLNLDPKRHQHGVYRVAVEPVAGKLVGEESGLKILIGYELLVLAQTENPQPKLVAKRNGRSLKLSNEGDTDVYLMEGKQCPSKNANTKDCAVLRSGRLYPGNKWTVSLPHDQPAEYKISVGTEHSLRSIP